MSQQASLTWIAICQMIDTALIFLVALGLFVSMWLLKTFVGKKIDQVLDRLQPILDQTKEIATQAKETAEKVSEKVDSIMTKAESTADKVTSRMDSVTAKVEQSVSPQAATVAGYLTTALKAFQLIKDISEAKKKASSHEREDHDAHI